MTKRPSFGAFVRDLESLVNYRPGYAPPDRFRWTESSTEVDFSRHEAMLLATCDLLPDEVREAASKLKLRLRGSIGHFGLAELIKIATTAGWLVPDQQDSSKPDIQAITDLVRRLRNLSHPGKHLRELRQVPLRRSAFRVAWYAIDAVRERLANKLGIELPPDVRFRARKV